MSGTLPVTNVRLNNLSSQSGMELLIIQVWIEEHRRYENILYFPDVFFTSQWELLFGRFMSGGPSTLAVLFAC